MIQFTFKYMRDRFDISVQSKYTILLRDNDFDPSLLAERVAQFALEPEYGGCDDGFSISAMTYGSWREALSSDSEVVVVDIDVLLDIVGTSSDVLPLMNSTDKYFILIWCGGVSVTPLADCSIFELEVVSEHHSRMIPARAETIRNKLFCRKRRCPQCTI